MAGDEQIRAQTVRPRRTLDLTPAESWQLLGGVSLGRVVFTQHAMPAIRPVNHLVDDETIIIRSHLGAVIVAHAGTEDGVVVCYEADELDPVRHTGWSVIATGLARLVRDPVGAENSPPSRDQAIFADRAAGASLSSDAVLLKIGRLGQRFQRRSVVQGAVKPAGTPQDRKPPGRTALAARTIATSAGRRCRGRD
jgi:Pyridoxamine 5'-phosphate oxidase